MHIVVGMQLKFWELSNGSGAVIHDGMRAESARQRPQCSLSGIQSLNGGAPYTVSVALSLDVCGRRIPIEQARDIVLCPLSICPFKTREQRQPMISV